MKNKIILGLIIFGLIIMPLGLGTAPNPGHSCSELETSNCESITSETATTGSVIYGINDHISDGYGITGSGYDAGVKGNGVNLGVQGTCTATGCYGLYTANDYLYVGGNRLMFGNPTSSNLAWFRSGCSDDTCITLGFDVNKNVVVKNNLAVEGKIVPYRSSSTPNIELVPNGNIIITLG